MVSRDVDGVVDGEYGVFVKEVLDGVWDCEQGMLYVVVLYMDC